MVFRYPVHNNAFRLGFEFEVQDALFALFIYDLANKIRFPFQGGLQPDRQPFG